MIGSRRAGGRAGVLVMAGCLSAGAVGASPPSPSPDELFSLGNQQYAHGDYAAATESYERILQQRIHNSRVYYNLGNACFKRNQIGRAILNYEKALKLDPTDTEARENLTFANQRIRDRIPADDLPYLVTLLERARDLLRPGQVTALFVGFYLVAMMLSGGWILGRRRRWGPAVGVAALVFSGLMLVAGGWALLQVRERNSADEAIVLTEKAGVLSGPGTENTLIASVHEGTKVRVHVSRQGWVQVTLPDGRAGWIQGDALGVI